MRLTARQRTGLTARQRIVVAVGSIAVLLAVAVGYLVMAARQSSQARGVGAGTEPAASSQVTASAGTAAGPIIDGTDDLVFVDATPGAHQNRLAVVSGSDPAGARREGSLDCDRVYAAGGHVICLRPTGLLAPAYQAVLLDYSMHRLHTIDLGGIPSRARLSADGNLASWTVFVTGDSYLTTGFATRTGVYDLRTGTLYANLETFSIIKDGAPYSNIDVNFWGVTVTRDDNTFYATLSTGGSTYLVRGDLRRKQVTTLVKNVECPSLSPDGTRIAFKERVDADGGKIPWRLTVLDLATMRRTATAELRNIDDQAAWLDDSTLAYALPIAGEASSNIWTVPADGTGSPRLLVPHASSPAALDLTHQ